MSCYHRQTCRLCSNDDLVNVLSLTPTPPANAFVPKQELNKKQECFPLDLWFCRNCSHLQLLDVVEPDILFSDYVYVSGTSPVFVKHFENYAASVIEYAKLPGHKCVIDIGSNDGTLLRFFKEAGCRVLGIDPAVNIANQASDSGIETIAAFFSDDVAKNIMQSHGSADVITANNVFAHMDDLQGVTKNIRSLLAPEGIFVFEVQYLLDLYQQTLFDMIYHEHLDYHSLQPLVSFFQQQDMELIRVERVPTHGGSLRCYVQGPDGTRPVDKSVAELAEVEKQAGLDQAETFISFAEEINAKGKKLRGMLDEYKGLGKNIAAFGAPAKATTLMYHYGINEDDISFIVDDSPLKQDLYSPGLHIPVLPATAIEEHKPDYLLILAWNFAESIIKKNQQFIENGGRFIVPLPEPEVV